MDAAGYNVSSRYRVIQMRDLPALVRLEEARRRLTASLVSSTKPLPTRAAESSFLRPESDGSPGGAISASRSRVRARMASVLPAPSGCADAGSGRLSSGASASASDAESSELPSDTFAAWVKTPRRPGSRAADCASEGRERDDGVGGGLERSGIV